MKRTKISLIVSVVLLTACTSMQIFAETANKPVAPAVVAKQPVVAPVVIPAAKPMPQALVPKVAQAVVPSPSAQPPAPVVQNTPDAVKPSFSFTDGQVLDIQKTIHDYLMQNPQLLREMSQALRAQEMNKMQSETKQQIPNYTKGLLDTTKHRFIGNEKGDVAIVEIFDYQCGHCKSMGEVMSKLVKSDPNLQVVFLEWPIFGPDSNAAVKAAFAAHKQGKYIEMHDALLAAENPLNQDKIKQVAKSIGLDQAKFTQDMLDKSLDDMVKSNVQIAKDLKLPATPAFIITNRKGDKFDFILGESSVEDLHKAVEGVRGSDSAKSK